MKVAVTGSTGFIGRHVVAALTAAGDEVIAVGRSVEGANAVRLDIHDAPADAYARMGSPDAVIHLAWAGLPHYKSLHHFESELPAQYRFLSGLVRSGVKRLVVTGTCFEYGMQSGALSEAMPAVPNNPYGFAKDSLRRQLQYLQAVQPFDLVWARLFYMYGAGQAANSLLPQLEAALERGDASFNMSGGEQLRDYLPVSEIARILVLLAQSERDVGVVNVCSGKPVSVRSLVEGFIAERGATIALNRGHYPYPDYEPMAFWGDATRLRSALSGASGSTL
ncbi:MAG: NAD(P)-dependent oxidoreductase [Hyphomicrobiaceae bacterium]